MSCLFDCFDLLRLEFKRDVWGTQISLRHRRMERGADLAGRFIVMGRVIVVERRMVQRHSHAG
jgi:hypothetical protein